MSGNLLVRFDEGSVGGGTFVPPSFLLYRETLLALPLPAAR